MAWFVQSGFGPLLAGHPQDRYQRGIQKSWGVQSIPNFWSVAYRSNIFDGIIFSFQLNIPVVAEEIATVAHDPQRRHSLDAYLVGRSFDVGSIYRSKFSIFCTSWE